MPRRIWRPLRSFLILICVGGAVVAADNIWLSDLRFDFGAADWWSNVSSSETPSADIAVAPEPANHQAPELSMGRLLNGSLFSPTSLWRLEDSPRHSSSLAWITASSSTAIATSPQSSSTPFVSLSISDSRSSAGAVVPDGGPPPPPGYWISNASGNWSNPSNWQGGVIANGSTAQAHFDTLDITTTVTVTLDSSRIIGELDVGDTNGTHRYDIAPGSGGERLIFDSNTSTSILHQSSTSAGDTISVPLFLNNDLQISNASTTNPLQISGGITGNRPTSTPWQITFLGTVFVSGDITPGSGSDLALNIGGNVILSGTNTYGGTTFVTGSLFVKGDNSGATGPVQVAGGGSLLSGKGTVGGIVTIFGGTITGGDTTTVGKLTLTQSLTIMASEGGGGTYLANLDGATSDLLAITGTLNIGNGTTLDIHGTADGTTTYILATFAGGGLSGMFDFVTGLPTDYTLVYTSSDIELVPTAIPEPSTWIGAALALGGIVFARRKRKR
ncbi:MAG TPA: PEP-CTERM sorting domain-containing protein [Chthoniobacterales bacterium]|nr:PEP-CTERM sorting domain-containing protein [Chthoniobacterales bacterium]